MAFRLFLDTNIFLDHLQQRSAESAEVIRMCERGDARGCASSGSLFTLSYFVEKAGRDPAQVLGLYGQFIDVISTDKLALFMAIDAKFSDFEDALQYCTALHHREVDFFITRNVSDFKKSKANLPVLTPERFLEEWA